MKNYKKIIAMMLVVSYMASLTACGNESNVAESEMVEAETAEVSEEGSVEDIEVTEEATNEQSIEEATQEQPVKEPVPYVDKLDRTEEGFVLVWNDEFDGDTLDTTKWDYQYGNGGEYGNPGWGNAEWQYYLNREENVKVEDGKLIITAVYESDKAMRYTSGRIRTITNNGEVLFATTYGRVEARIKMPVGEGLWPAFWMLPVDESIYGSWAASGELDIMEAKGRLPGQFSCAAHYGGEWPKNSYSGQEYVYHDGTTISDFHLYSMEWEPGEIRFYVDNECYYTLTDWFSMDSAETHYEKPAPFDIPFYIILNMAIGGNFDKEADAANAEYPAAMEVDFVRVYHKEAGYGEDTSETEIVE
uniref:glycoside hydrolase family 16 protein n=1 Tax=Acetatifactor sp. TaxID=1872090 RepID=UPI004056BFE4